MQPHHTRILHGFDARSILLFATLTMGGTQAVLARSELPDPRSTTRHTAQVAPSRTTVPYSGVQAASQRTPQQAPRVSMPAAHSSPQE